MYIKSTFADYYDAMQKTGIGDGITYDRYHTHEGMKTEIPTSYYIIGVCWQRFLVYFDGKEYIYDMNQVRKLIEAKKYKRFENAGIARKAHDKAMKMYKEFYNFNLAPIWVARDIGVDYNCRLWRYRFHEVMDAPTIYQELCMWFNNYAEPRKVIPAISNEDMIQAKGFDLKYSFRKAKSKKR